MIIAEKLSLQENRLYFICIIENKSNIDGRLAIYFANTS